MVPVFVIAPLFKITPEIEEALEECKYNFEKGIGLKAIRDIL